MRTAWSSGAEEGLISSRTTPYFLCGQDKQAVSSARTPRGVYMFSDPKNIQGLLGSSTALVEPQYQGPVSTTPRDPLSPRVPSPLECAVEASTASLVSCRATLSTALAGDPGSSLFSPWW